MHLDQTRGSFLYALESKQQIRFLWILVAQLLTFILSTSCSNSRTDEFQSHGYPQSSSLKRGGLLSPQSIFKMTIKPNDPLFPDQWHFENHGQISARGKMGKTGADIRFTHTHGIPETQNEIIIAVLDSGLEFSHPDLNADKIFLNRGEFGLDSNTQNKQNNGIDDDRNGYIDDIYGWNFADKTPHLTDSLGHGTHITGLLIARNNNGLGIAAPWKGIKVLPLQIFSGKRPSADSSTISAAIYYAVNMGAKVISASFGTPTPTEELRNAVRYAQSNDVIFVSAVGNMRMNHDLEPSYPSGFHLENQISVGAMERRGLPTNFTNFGNSVDIFAPGEDILSLSPSGAYAIRSGTSQACPLVAGAAATARLLYPHENALEIKNRLLNSADEREGLMGFVAKAKSLNIDNIVLNKTGARIPTSEFSTWKTLDLRMESEHPYRSNTSAKFNITLPPEARAFRLHFSRFITQSTDVVEIIDSENNVIASLSGTLNDFWSPVINGASTTVTFITDQYVSDFGWIIDRVEYLD